MVSRLLAWLDRIPSRLVLHGSLGLAALIAVLDYLTGFELSFALFYLLPIGLAGWVGRRVTVLSVAVLCAALSQASYLLSGGQLSQVGTGIWNAASRLIIFAIIGLLVRAVRWLLGMEQDLARTDPLTGLPNRRGLEDAWDALSRRWTRGGSVCLAIVDLDRFKQLNDEKGHAQGDAALQEWAQLTRQILRSDDVVARAGGDEFVILLPRAARHVALARLDRLKTIAEARFAERKWPLGLSMGVAFQNKGPPRWSELMSRADLQLYRAKDAGRGLIHAED